MTLYSKATALSKGLFHGLLIALFIWAASSAISHIQTNTFAQEQNQ